MSASIFGSSKTKSPGIAGRIFGCLFGLAFAGFGGFFIWIATITPLLTYWEGQSWREVQATIVRSEVRSEGDDLEPDLRYRYPFEGKEFHSEQVDLLSKNRDYAEVQKLSKDLPVGYRTTAFIDPDEPSRAVLFRDLDTSVFLGLFALIFVFAGLGIAGFSLFAKQSKNRKTGFSKGAGNKRKWGLVLLSLPFIGLGSAFFWVGGLSPYLKSREATEWVNVPCTIDRSFVQSHSDSDGTTYSIEIRFTYEWEGEVYKGENYSFVTSSSSGRSSKAAVVRRYPEGSEATCFVNPEDPYEAVITTDVGWLPFALMGFASIFIIVGIVLFVLGLRPKKSALADPGSSLPGNLSSSSGTLVLKPKTSRMAKTAGSTIFAVIWNGVVVGMFLSWRSGEGGLFLLLFVLVFGAIGVGAAAFAVYCWLSLRNPIPVVRVTPSMPRPGEKIQFSWSLKGSVSRLDTLAVYLEGSEIARYRRGTKTVTDDSVFFQQILCDFESRGDFRTGEAEIILSPETVPTMKTDHNEIEWSVLFNGTISKWPDLRETFTLPVFAGRPRKNSTYG